MSPYLSFGIIKVPSYSFFISAGIVLSLVIIRHETKRKNENLLAVTLSLLVIFLGSFIGSHLLFLVLHFSDINWKLAFSSVFRLSILFNTGFVFYGGLLGGILSLFIFGKLEKTDFIKKYDYLVFTLPLAHALGRIGCFLSGCCYGIPYDGFLSVVFPPVSLGLSGVKLFPVQLLESGLLFVLSLVLYLCFTKREKQGELETYLISYSLMRFLLEFLRYDNRGGRDSFLFSPSQIISLLILLSIFFLHVHRNWTSTAQRKQIKSFYD